MRTSFAFLIMLFAGVASAQNNEQQVRNYLKTAFPGLPSPQNVWFFQCRYKRSKNWQYLVACQNQQNNQKVSTLLFTERLNDTSLIFEPFHFFNVESFDHLNMDNSNDRIEEFNITTVIDSGNLQQKYTGIYSFKKGYCDTLIRFYSFTYKSLQAPYFNFQPGKVVEQEDLFQLADLNNDGKLEVANRVHRKMVQKEPGGNAFSFDHETDYAEYKFVKGRLEKIKSKTGITEGE